MTVENSTVKALLNRRSIRAFEDAPLDQDTIDTLESVAQCAASSQYLNDWSAIRITNPELKEKIAQIGGQSYIASAPLLYVFVLDEYRNACIAAQDGVDVHSEEFTLNSMYRFTQAQNDAVLALHAMETAAYSMDLGCVILGSILNDVQALVEILGLPEFTYPVLGLAIGKPAQEPAIKPRLPKTMQFFENSYERDPDVLLHDFADFDESVHHYYDLRSKNHPLPLYSKQIVKKATDAGVLAHNFTTATEQGFSLK